MTTSSPVIFRVALLVACLAAFGVASGCRKATNDTAKQAPLAPLLISAEDLLTIRSNALSLGPTITGSVQPERRADLRAEVSAVVLAVQKENGDPVRRGDLLVRLDDTSIRDALIAAEASANAASQAYDQAERQYQRLVKLREGGVVSTQQLEDVEIRRNAAQSDREAARTRVVTARQQLARTTVRAPFDGIVSDRKVSGGDTAQVGKELLKVIDPASLRFEGFVSADSVGEVRPGQQVTFNIHGFADRTFQGSITRVNPAANATTRQVEVLVNFADAKEQPNVAGLYAEGRIETRRAAALTLPAAALVRDGDHNYAWRVKDNKLQKVSLALGDRDPRTGEYVLTSGLSEGDTVLHYPNAVLQDGQAVEMSAQAKPVEVEQ
ncbi:MAG: efflux RND transporter periplasmic adaptor subunit [Pseudomonadota bacterium]